MTNEINQILYNFNNLLLTKCKLCNLNIKQSIQHLSKLLEDKYLLSIYNPRHLKQNAMHNHFIHQTSILSVKATAVVPLLLKCSLYIY